jgi:hypothetical protein
LNHRNELFKKFRQDYLHIYTEEPLSEFNPDLAEKLHPNQRLKGFFTTCLYLEKLQNMGLFRTLSLKNPSNWYQMKEKIAIQENPIAVHIRRGDFMQSKDTHGVLNESYYRSALKIARKDFPGSPIWVFTNAIDDVRKWSIFQNNQPVFIENEFTAQDGTGDDPAEHLMLMSCSKAIIVANSSFSLFAAMLSTNVELVLCPNPVAKSPEYGVGNFYPDTWIKVDAEWE